MRTIRPLRTITVVVLLVLAATAAGAQTVGKNELSVFGGISLLDATGPGSPNILAGRGDVLPLIYPPPFESSRRLGGSGEFGVRYGRDLTSALTLTGDFSVAPAHELTERIAYGCPDPIVCIARPARLGLVLPDYSYSERVVAYHYGGGLRLNIRPGLLTPALVAGIGGVTFAGNNDHDTAFAVRIGGSLTAAVRNLTAGVELVDTIVTDHVVTNETEHDVHLRLSFGVRW